MNKNKSGVYLLIGAIAALGFGAAAIFNASPTAALVGPSGPAGTGSGAFAVNATGSVSIATTTFSASKLRVAGSIQSTTGGFVFPDGTTQTTAAVTTGVTSTPAGYVTPGNFNSVAGTGGNYTFPANLAVGTTTFTSSVIGSSGRALLVGGGSQDAYIQTLNGTGSAKLELSTNASEAFLGYTGATKLSIYDGTDRLMTFDGSANYAGIGTTAPSSTLHVKGTSQTVANFDTTGSRAGQIQVDGGSSGVGSGGGILFGAFDKPFASIRGYIGDASSNGHGDLVFGTRNAPTDSTLTERMRILSTGNIGVGGLTLPGYPLDIKGSTRMRHTGTIASSTAGSSLFFSDNSPTNIAEIQSYDFDGTNYGMKFRAWNGSALTDVMSVSGSGTVTLGTGSGKINVGTVDPIYTIGDKRYATFLPGMTGVKEETTGNIALHKDSSGKWSGTLDFKNAADGSDLWLFAKTTDLKDNFDKLVVLLTPSFPGDAWYEKDPAGQKVTIFADPSGGKDNLEVSYRLTAPRFDAGKWSNSYTDQDGNQGLVVE